MILEFLDEAKFKKYFSKLYTMLNTYEQQKNELPNYSYAVKDLAIHYGVYEKTLMNIPYFNDSLAVFPNKGRNRIIFNNNKYHIMTLD